METCSVFVRDKFLTPSPPRWNGTIPFPKKQILSVACGGSHLLVAARDPHDGIPYAYSSGLNKDGQLGHGDTTTRHELTRVEALSNVHAVAAGSHHSLALSAYGKQLHSFGRGQFGQLGIGNVTSEADIFKTSPQLVLFPKRVIVTKIACGDSHSMAVTIEKELYTWGFGTMLATGHVRNAIGEEGKDMLRPSRLVIGSPLCVSGGGHHSVVLVHE
jgi:alpha-tubulin suppressor-like RCC1 family protein